MLRQDPFGHGELAAAPVDDDEGGRIGEPAGPPPAISGAGLRPPVGRRHQPGQPPAKDFLHGSKVVLSGHSPYLESAIVASLGQAVLEYHHGPDRVGRPEVGDVVRLDPQRREGQPQHVAELGEGPRSSGEVAGPPELVAGEGLLGGVADDLEQPAAIPASRDRDADPAVPDTAQPALQDVLVGRPGRHQDPGRDLVAVHVQLPEEGPDQPGRVDVLDLVDDPAPAPHDPSPPDEEHLERGFEVVLLHPDHVEVILAGQHHLLALDGLAGRGELVAKLGRPLELQDLRRLAHLGVDPGQDRFVVAGQEVGHRLDQLPVSLFGHPRGLRHARARAPADVVVEARPAGPSPLVEEGVGAGPDGEDPGQRVEGLADGVGVAVGAEIADVLALGAAQDPRPRPPFTHREGEVRIGLVVPIADVEPGAVGLDQVVLEHQGVDLGGSHDPLHRLGLLEHGLGPGMKRAPPVRGQALPERHGLADVDDPGVGIPEQVGARCVGDRR